MKTNYYWFSNDGTTCYAGSARDGLEWSRHSWSNDHGFWRVAVTGWVGMSCRAVIDDFGSLVRVPA